MSCFVVSPETLQMCVAALEPKDSDAGDILGAKLAKMNADAWAIRYSEPCEPIEFRWRFQMPPESLRQLCRAAKALDCLIYQCSEGDVPKSLLYQAVTRQRDKLCRKIVNALDDYKEAPWDYDSVALRA